MNRTRMDRYSLLFAIALVAAGCGGSGSDDPGVVVPQTGTLSIAITDAPVDEAAAIVIAMTEFEFKPAGDEPPFRVDVEGAPRQLNLIDFTDGMSAVIIDGEEVPAGDYDWMRIYFDEDLSYVQLEMGGEQYPIFIPSGAQTGYKLNSGFEVPINASVEYMLDFDVRKSLLEPPGLGGPGNRVFLLKPTVRLMNVADTGAISGVVASELVDINNARCQALDEALRGNAVYAFDGHDAPLDDIADEEEFESDGRAGPLTSDVVEMNSGSGEFEYHLMFLLPGDYTLAFTCSAGADGAEDTDYTDEGAGENGFDFDAQINVTVESGIEKSCAIPPGDTQPDPC